MTAGIPSGKVPALRDIDAAWLTGRLRAAGFDIGHPLTDVSYFVGASLRPEVRRPVEEDLVRFYYQAVCDAGIENFAWTDCWAAYRWGSLHGFASTVIASGIVAYNERSEKLFATMADRHAAHARDMEAAELLE